MMVYFNVYIIIKISLAFFLNHYFEFIIIEIFRNIALDCHKKEKMQFNQSCIHLLFKCIILNLSFNKIFKAL